MSVHFPDLPIGHNLACTAAQARRMGYWLAKDEKGYEYVVGFGFVRDDNKRPIAFQQTDCYGTTKRWQTDDDHKLIGEPFVTVTR